MDISASITQMKKLNTLFDMSRPVDKDEIEAATKGSYIVSNLISNNFLKNNNGKIITTAKGKAILQIIHKGELLEKNNILRKKVQTHINHLKNINPKSKIKYEDNDFIEKEKELVNLHLKTIEISEKLTDDIENLETRIYYIDTATLVDEVSNFLKTVRAEI